ncbi:hypothetical protein L2E82_45221 [Cichorium intybus]|uniref:Uncharacterized protein n=1 Tax=Cichorium intybus TaxID=13427 RepID=A0ACB8ZWS4_CICIN|nr:hypothetical protein L2E82_45221 [Cichorium intybus]
MGISCSRERKVGDDPKKNRFFQLRKSSKKPPNQELSMLLQLNHGILVFNNQNLMEPLVCFISSLAFQSGQQGQVAQIVVSLIGNGGNLTSICLISHGY